MKPGYNPISRYEALASLGEIEDNKIIIDCSCGNGMEGKKICNIYKPYIYLGIDVDELAIGRARDLNLPSPYEFVVGDIKEIVPIKADYYFCVETLEHISKHENLRVGKAITKSIKFGGLLLISVPGNPKIAMEDPRHKQIITKDIIDEMFPEMSLVKEGEYVKFFGRMEAYSSLYILKRS